MRSIINNFKNMDISPISGRVKFEKERDKLHIDVAVIMESVMFTFRPDIIFMY